jgi:hypothetical protein
MILRSEESWNHNPFTDACFQGRREIGQAGSWNGESLPIITTAIKWFYGRPKRRSVCFRLILSLFPFCSYLLCWLLVLVLCRTCWEMRSGSADCRQGMKEGMEKFGSLQRVPLRNQLSAPVCGLQEESIMYYVLILQTKGPSSDHPSPFNSRPSLPYLHLALPNLNLFSFVSIPSSFYS